MISLIQVDPFLYRQAKYLARQFGNRYYMLNSSHKGGLRKPG